MTNDYADQKNPCNLLLESVQSVTQNLSNLLLEALPTGRQARNQSFSAEKLN